MKRLLSISLALSLLGSSVAMAHEYPGVARHSYSTASLRDHRDRGGNTAAALGIGMLAFGLFGALAASQNHDYAPSYYAPPAPAYAYPGYGYAAPSVNFGFYAR